MSNNEFNFIWEDYTGDPASVGHVLWLIVPEETSHSCSDDLSFSSLSPNAFVTLYFEISHLL